MSILAAIRREEKKVKKQLATFHRKYKASKRVFMGFRLIVRC
jgi:hypothetical protein